MPQTIHMIPDPCFHQGFSALGLMDGTEGHTEVTRLTCGDPDATPRWRTAAWCSRYSFADPACNARSHPREGVYVFTNPSKEVTVDTRTGTLGLFLKASEVYTDGLRQKDTPWAHLLLETDFTSMERPAPEYRLCGLQSLAMSMECQLAYFHGDRSVQDDEIHAAQFVFFLVVQNRNPQSPGCGEMIWFSIPAFDNRYPYIERSIQYDEGTQALMVSVDPRSYLTEHNNFWQDGAIRFGEDTPWVRVQANILAELNDAYHQAKARGYIPRTQWEDLYIGGMNTGWELPGTYDCRMNIRDLRLDGTL